MDHDPHMLELRLRSGEIVTFDGRVLEIFRPEGASARVHAAQIEAAVADGPDGTSTVRFGDGVGVRFAREETPACERLLAALAESHRAYD